MHIQVVLVVRTKMKILNKDVGDRFDREMSRGYKTQDDYIDTPRVVQGYTNYLVIDQLRGESRKRWLKIFGNS